MFPTKMINIGFVLTDIGTLLGDLLFFPVECHHVEKGVGELFVAARDVACKEPPE
jgi:hypothetical protein